MAEFPKTIVLKSLYGRKDEGRAAAAVTPGQLIELDANLKVIRHATAGGFHRKQFAVEDGLRGKTISDDYAINDVVFYHICSPGDEIYAWLDAGQNLAADAVVMSAGNGNLTAYTAPAVAGDHPQAVGELLEAVDATAGAARVKVRVY